jgi:mono/diheme cytochrome c family protein
MSVRVLTLLLLATGAVQAADVDSAKRSGAAVFERWCAICHSVGPFMPGTNALQLKYQGRMPALLKERRDLTPELVKVFVRKGVGIMAPFRKTEISDVELEALALYLSHRE